MTAQAHRNARIASNDRFEGWNVWRDCAYAMATPRKNALPRETYLTAAHEALLLLSPAARERMEPSFNAARVKVRELQYAGESAAIEVALSAVEHCDGELAKLGEAV